MNVANKQLLDRIGLPKNLVWGFIGMFLFMLGATIESSWFSSYLVEIGISSASVGFIFTAYGIIVMVSAWFTGVGSQIVGIKKTMWLGVGMYYLASIPLLMIALPLKSFPLILVTYMLRGSAYPLFAYSFLVWMNYKTDRVMLGRAASWYWIFFNLGMTIMGPLLASWLIPIVGQMTLLYFGLVSVGVGAACALFFNRESAEIPPSTQSPIKEVTEGITIMFTRPRLGISVLVKSINDFGKFGYVIVMPLYLTQFGFTTSEWLTVWGAINFLTIFTGYLLGYIGDKIGWRKTIVWLAGPSCGVATLLLYFLPQVMGHNFLALIIPLIFYAVGLAAYGPLTALIPSLAPDKKGAAISCLNLGSGSSNFLAPLVVSLFIAPFGPMGAMLAIAFSFFGSSVLSIFLKTPEELQQDKVESHATERSKVLL